MKQGKNELVIIIDRSGSMNGLRDDVVGGYNALLEEQRKNEGTVLVTTVFFDTRIDTVTDRKLVKELEPMEAKDYVPGGCTALLDAIGSSIDRVEQVHASLTEDELPEHVIFSIMTDGLENSSREYSYEKVRNMISAHKEKGWDFLFQAANIDALGEGRKLGVSDEDIASFTANAKGVKMCFATQGVRMRGIMDGRKPPKRKKPEGKR